MYKTLSHVLLTLNNMLDSNDISPRAKRIVYVKDFNDMKESIATIAQKIPQIYDDNKDIIPQK